MMLAFSKSKSGFAGVCVNAEGIGANKAVTRMSKQSRFTSVPPTARARVNFSAPSVALRRDQRQSSLATKMEISVKEVYLLRRRALRLIV